MQHFDLFGKEEAVQNIMMLCVKLLFWSICFVLQIDGYCQSKGLVIAGYYHANENIQDSVYVTGIDVFFLKSNYKMQERRNHLLVRDLRVRIRVRMSVSVSTFLMYYGYIVYMCVCA